MLREPHLPEDLTRLSDEELARRTQAGASACFGELVSRHEGRLLRFLVQRTGHVQDAEDLLQDTFARAYQRIESYDANWKLSTWLYTIASRLACSHYRKRSAMPIPDAIQPVRDPGQDPAAIAAGKEETHNLWSLAAEALSDNQYRAVWLRYAEEMSVKEISRVMKKTQSHVKVLLFRGRSSLGRRLRSAQAAGCPQPFTPPAPAPCTSGAKGGG